MADEKKSNVKIPIGLGKNIGVSGLNRYSGLIYEEFVQNLQGSNGVKVYKEMSSNDSTIGGFLRAIFSLVSQVNWSVETEDKKAKELIEYNLEKISIESQMSEILSMLVYGWSWFELIYEKNSKGIGWRKWAIRSQDSLQEWKFSDNGDLLGFYQSAPPTYETTFIPVNKSIHFVYEKYKENPEGKSILRNAYEAYYYKRNISKIEAIGIERDLVGLPVAWVPLDVLCAETTEASTALTEYKKMITNIKRDEQEGIVYPLEYDEEGNKLYDLSLLESKGKRNFDTSIVINRYKADMLVSVLADFLQLGQDGSGSYGLAEAKIDLFMTSLKAILKNVAKTIEKQAIDVLLNLNGMLDVKYKLTYHNIKDVNVMALSDFINKVGNQGFITRDFATENRLREMVNLPLKDEADYPQDLKVTPQANTGGKVKKPFESEDENNEDNEIKENNKDNE